LIKSEIVFKAGHNTLWKLAVEIDNLLYQSNFPMVVLSRSFSAVYKYISGTTFFPSSVVRPQEILFNPFSSFKVLINLTDKV